MDLEQAFAHAQSLIGTKFKIQNNTLGIISLIIDIVEDISNTIKSTGIAISGKEKLKLSFDLTEKIVRHLESRELISIQVAEEVISKSNQIEVYTETVSSIVSIINSHAPKIVASLRKCCC